MGRDSRNAWLAVTMTTLMAVACGRAPSPRHPVVPAPISSSAPEIYSPPAVPGGWLGGNREVLIGAPPSAVMAVLGNPESYRHLLAMVRSLRVVREIEPGHFLLEVEQGSSLVSGKYSVHLARDRGDLVRFWVDRGLPRDVDDAYGFFLIAPDGEGTRLRYHVAVDLGGVFAFLYSGKVERSALSTADRTRRYIETLRGSVPKAPASVTPIAPAPATPSAEPSSAPASAPSASVPTPPTR